MQALIPALILAGGNSSRMGQDKASVTLAGRTLLTRVVQRVQPQVSTIAINSNMPNADGLLVEFPIVPDSTSMPCGPLSGILTGMEYYARRACTHFLTVSVDCPFLPDDLVTRLMQGVTDAHSIAIARSNGKTHPTIGIWPVALNEELRNWLDLSSRYSVKAFLDGRQITEIEFPDEQYGDWTIDPFFNVNTPSDLARASQIAARM